MTKYELESDGLINYSDNYGSQKKQLISSEKTKSTPTYPSPSRSHSPGISNRTVQALWKTRVQVCPWSRPWAQVLPLCQQIRSSTGNRLRSPTLPGAGQRISRQFAQNTGDPGRDLFNQPRASTPQRAIIDRTQQTRGQRAGFGRYRTQRYWHLCCQYAKRIGAYIIWKYFIRRGRS